MTGRVPALAAIAAALLAGGCGGGGGGGQSDKQKIETTVTTYYKAFGTSDSATACNQLAEQTTKELERAAGGRKCPVVLDQAAKKPEYAKVAAKLDGVKVVSVKITGTTATATTQVPGLTAAGGTGVSTTVPLKKEAGGWKIASTIGEG
ncbi:MAG: hypothetical protein QOC95_145 [Thermoleophilaceae bacterium]|nr:hypothetical protein [Thermoleophilaceae bacterium]